MLDVSVRGVVMSGAAWVVLLDSSLDDRTLPIAIGTSEAQSILFQLNGIEFPRPLTHDLFRQVLAELGVKVTRVDITELRDETFFAKLCLESPAGLIEVDARPSDALALALRCDTPVRVAERVMDTAGIVMAVEPPVAVSGGCASEEDALSLLKAQLAEAVARENYEEAAVLRDRISRVMAGAGSPGASSECDDSPEDTP